NPHHFSFNSPLGWCPTCQGLGVQKGASAALLIRDPRCSLHDGALTAWPPLTADNPFSRFAEALARHLGFSLDIPFEQLEPAQQRAVLHGTGDVWIPLEDGGAQNAERRTRNAGRAGAPRSALPAPRFQYKGLFPAIDEASRVSFVYRHKLEHLVSEVPCST